ncbi:hypothetical protein HD806DRAFT_351760 [Xylariaceae sp. AK1471]|nr:hypothetical protein HD806DRAFT_351760 [Xylariaceae sp. AK1471]
MCLDLSPLPASLLYASTVYGKRENRHATNTAHTGNYAVLRLTLHSDALKQVEKIQEALTLEVGEKIDVNLAKISKITDKANQLSTSSLDCEVEQQIATKDNQQRIATVQVRAALARYQKMEAERSNQLDQLWGLWEKSQTDIDKLSNKLHNLFEREPTRGTRGMSSSSCEWADQEDLDIGRRSKQVVEDMTACEEVSPSPNPDPTLSGSLKS